MSKFYDKQKLNPPSDEAQFISISESPRMGSPGNLDTSSNETFNFLAKLGLESLEKLTKVVIQDYTNKITYFTRVINNFMNCVSDLLKDSHNPMLNNS